MEQTNKQPVKPKPSQQDQHDAIGKSPVRTPAAGHDHPDAQTQAAGFAEHQTPETIAGKTPTGLPPIERAERGDEHDDPVRRAAERITSIDNANMAATDNSVDVDGKGMEARRDAPMRQDNVIHSNATLDDATSPPAEGLGGIDSRPPTDVATRPGWQVRDEGTVMVEQGEGSLRPERVFRFERETH